MSDDVKRWLAHGPDRSADNPWMVEVVMASDYDALRAERDALSAELFDTRYAADRTYTMQVQALYDAEYGVPDDVEAIVRAADAELDAARAKSARLAERVARLETAHKAFGTWCDECSQPIDPETCGCGIMRPQQFALLIVLGLAILVGFGAFACAAKTVPVGHVSVATKFGEPRGVWQPGFHVESPMYEWHDFDCRARILDEKGVSIQTQDQLSTMADCTVQWRLDDSMAEVILTEVGDNLDAVEGKILVPQLRSLIRESGKTFTRAEALFEQESQERLQGWISERLSDYCAERGVVVESVLVRNLQLPPFIEEAIQRKKEREQRAEEQKAELERFRTEQEQKVAEAQAQRDAAALQAERILLLAEADAKSIKLRGEAIKATPSILRMQAIDKWDGIMPRIVGTDGMEFIIPTEHAP